MLEASCSDKPIESGLEQCIGGQGHTLFHNFRVPEFIHASLELLGVLGKPPILAQLILKHVYERLERGFRESVVTTSTRIELRRRANRQRVVRRV